MSTLTETLIGGGGEQTALNLQELYDRGIAIIRELSGSVWTDHNIHDPGITVLEVLCYALTDLGFRAGLPIEDLLASETDNAANMAKQFPSARQVLPNRPLTDLDYRKLLIDLPGVKNAWLSGATETYYADLENEKLLDEDPGSPTVVPVELKGLYNVLIDYMEGLTHQQKSDTLDRVRETLHSNRNLCEDFVAVEEVSVEEFVACGELEIDPDADAVSINARLLFELQSYLAPAVRNYSLAEMLRKRKPDGGPYLSPDIFDGPALATGFIPDEELRKAELRTEIRLSDAINIVMDIPGVRAVKDLVINRAGETLPVEDKWIVPVTVGKKALLDIAHSRLILYKRYIPVLADPERVAAAFRSLVEDERDKLEIDRSEDFPIPLGRYRNPGEYYSLQNHLPAIYGVSDIGVPANADARRRAKALQLKGYLLFFDQLLANGFAQLGNLRDLFSADPAQQRSYFHQRVDTFRDWADVYSSGDPVTDIENSVEDKTAVTDRRQRFLDHLIGRFAEEFSAFVNTAHAAFGISPQLLIQHKCDFLNHYPAISSERGLAYDYSLKINAALWNSVNVSGLERRIARMLGIRNFSRRNLSEITHDIYAEVDSTPGDEFRFRIRHPETGDILLSSSTHYVTEADALTEMYQAIVLAATQAGYERKVASNGKHYFNIVNGDNEVVARRIEYFDEIAAMEAAIDELIDHLQTHYADEGMYLIENILLRPEQTGDPMLPICVDANCADCADRDPYSYRVQIILPAYSTRFSNQDFRRFAESVIRAEVPAHILPRICWIGREDMAALEGHYRAWISLKSGRTHANRLTKLRNFIDRLFAVKNVYPTQQLGDCDSDEKFVLDHTSLGSYSPGND